jgi:hypothetical protein
MFFNIYDSTKVVADEFRHRIVLFFDRLPEIVTTTAPVWRSCPISPARVASSLAILVALSLTDT